MTVVGIREDEYEDLLVKVREIHESLISMIQETTEEIESLIQNEGGFGLDRVNEKIELLLGEIKTLSETMQEVFEAEETIIESFRRAVEDADICN